EGVKVDTPNLDQLASEGALLNSFYVSSPVCSPSRAAFTTSLMPHVTGVPTNDVPMYDNMVTFAEILGRNGYATGYLGKWHLDGDGKPEWEPKRKFGWQDNRYMFNRGHYKKLKDTPEGPRVDAKADKNGIPSYDLNNADEKSYTTDFLMDRTLEFIRKHKDESFCVMLSLPDPHGPNRVRDPYWDKYRQMPFEAPATMFKTPDQVPAWSSQTGSNYIEDEKLDPDQMAAIFGMIECIDDNMGRLLGELKQLNLEDNTIVVFTSDHGDLMGEHRRHNKGVPFEASAKVAFLMKSPGQIPAGKVINSVMTSVDFGPTVLSLMGIGDKFAESHGRDFSQNFTSKKPIIDGERIAYFRGTTNHPDWVAAVSDSYKLVISDKCSPWLYDLKKDPNELINFYEHPDYREIRV
ncbi:MAG: sulfatase-like hydrolase/transferase, partial [Verrucomicrobiae bacterium]|nr:sulfatase-like hydrolase/transferase [Verrucomicrobiae bacterium]